jgi:hypothetical protein
MFTPAPHIGFPLPPLSSSGLADSGSGRPLEGLSVFGPSRLVRAETDGASEHRQSTLEPRRRRRLTSSSLFGRPSVRPLRSRCSHRFSVVPNQPADDTVAQSLSTFLPLVPLDRVDVWGSRNHTIGRPRAFVTGKTPSFATVLGSDRTNGGTQNGNVRRQKHVRG